MLIENGNVFIYVVAWDLGFAPNPFGGVCSLACCKPDIRRLASVGDWIVGMGGGRLKATGRCIFAMQVSEALTFDEYWVDARFQFKRPVRNGARKKMVGDNIYHRSAGGHWEQESSVHSKADGLPDPYNTAHDTRTDRVLLSERFVYFGAAAPTVPAEILEAMGYKNQRGYRKFKAKQSLGLFGWLDEQTAGRYGIVNGAPFHFASAHKHYDKKKDRLA